MIEDVVRTYPTVLLCVPTDMQIRGGNYTYYKARRQRTTYLGRFGFCHERAVVVAPLVDEVRSFVLQFSIELRHEFPYQAQTPVGNGTTLYFCVAAATLRDTVEAMAVEIFRLAAVKEWREMR